MKAILLRVGIDSTYGALSPVWDDMSYIYFPIFSRNIKEIERGEKRTYKTLFGSDVKFLPEKLHNNLVHYDPEFESFTYGDPSNLKHNFLISLEEGDLFVFYMGGVLQNKSKEKGCFIIGYFEVEKTFIGSSTLTPGEKVRIKKEYPNNAHVISSKTQRNLVIVKGSKKSKKLDRCIKITQLNKKSRNPLYITKPKYQKELGLREFIIRAVPIVLKEENHINNLKKLLNITS
ncbi:MAG: hypothetical protein IAE93_06000 [Ignavibacteria bacterium]|mgnify:CR=1 FL=1|nr:hypothetical protein [Ignavibacteria bacterium]